MKYKGGNDEKYGKERYPKAYLMYNHLPGGGLIRLGLHQHVGEDLVSHPDQALVCPTGWIDTSGMDNPVHIDGHRPVPGLAGGP